MPAAPPIGPDGADLEQAVRRLVVRARREASGPFAGAWTAAFRGGGIEFEESRPYVPGDDVRSLDWNATARTGEPYVKRFREERDQSVVLLLDVSGSMDFASGGRSKRETAAHAAALVAAAAGHAGDRVGLVVFDDLVRLEIPPDRGPAHIGSVVRAAAAASRQPGRRGTDVAAALERARALAGRRSVLFALSDFRDEPLFTNPAAAGALSAACRRHDLVCAVVGDRREEWLVRGGPIRITDPERPGRVWLLDTGRAQTRQVYAAAAAVRRRALARRLRGSGADVAWLDSGADPLHALVRFFAARASRARVAA